jgi:dTMP kinase
LQSRLLVGRLRARGLSVLATHEPGGTPLSDHLRELLLLRDDLRPSERAEALMMCASRAQLVAEVIAPELERGAVVVCDRYADSTLAYQGYGRGLAILDLNAVISFATAGLTPEMTMLLDLPVEAGLARKQAQVAAWNRFEAEAIAFHERVRAGYHELARLEPRRWHCFDASKAPDALADDIWACVGERLDLT